MSRELVYILIDKLDRTVERNFEWMKIASDKVSAN